jgi:hypothetical protein
VASITPNIIKKWPALMGGNAAQGLGVMALLALLALLASDLGVDNE